MQIPSSSTSFHCRVVMIGDASVGKTSLLTQIIDHKFNPVEASTIGANYQIYNDIIEGTKAEIQVWDTAGQERFRSLGPIYFRNALGAMTVFDLTNRHSFEDIDGWVRSFVDVAGTEAVIMIIGNKSDLTDEIVVSQAEIQEYASQRNYLYATASAKTGEGVKNAFQAFTAHLIEVQKRKTRAKEEPAVLEEKEKKGCC